MTDKTIKTWLSGRGISYRRLAAEMDQSPASISLKVNGKVGWKRSDLSYLKRHYGLSSDFVLGLTSNEGKEVVLSG